MPPQLEVSIESCEPSLNVQARLTLKDMSSKLELGPEMSFFYLQKPNSHICNELQAESGLNLYMIRA